jgi:flagellar biosynthesis protein FlhG
MTDILAHRPARRALTITVTSGKGGVGKTSVVVNLAVALAGLDRKVGVLDADFSLGNVDVMLGLTPRKHLGHLLAGEATIDDIVVVESPGVHIIPASSGLRELTALTPVMWQRLNQALETLSQELDFIIVDTASGIGDNVVDLACQTERVLIVTSLDPSSIVDAYAMVKVLTAADRRKEIGVVVNGVGGERDGRLVFQQLDVAAERFLQRRLRYYGFIMHDQAIREAVLNQTTVVDRLPQAPSSRCFRALATRLSGLTSNGGPGLRLVPPPLQAAAEPVGIPRWA